MRLLSSVLITSLFISVSHAAPQSVHTWHTITSLKGNWHGRLQTIYEKANFVDQEGNRVRTFDISPQNSLRYGFEFGANADFDISYTLTLTETSDQQFTSKTCLFIVTAKGPADPDIRYLSYNGANCRFQIVPGVGENFSVF